MESFGRRVEDQWKSEAPFNIKQVSSQSYALTFQDRQDFKVFNKHKWKFWGSDIILIRMWAIGESTEENAL